MRWLVVLFACSSPAPRETTPPAARDTPPPPQQQRVLPTDVAANPAACPARFEQIKTDCVNDQRGIDCTYEKNACRCEGPGGGAPVPPEVPFKWHCEPLVRADGCPGLAPYRGPCSAGQSCSYEKGTYVLECKQGHWVVIKEPPPAA
jgi:hypothetical protein